MERAPGDAANSPRDIVNYLLHLRPVLQRTTQVRRDWIRDVGLLIEESRTGDPVSLARAAGRLGHGAIPLFREARLQVSQLRPPPECGAMHESVLQWLQEHLSACDALVRAEQGHNLRPVREAQERLADGRWHSQRFNAEYARLVKELRDRVDSALSRRRSRGRGGPTPRRRKSRPFWALLRRLPRGPS